MAKLERVTTLALELRTNPGTTGAKATRRAGKIPGVLYGHGTAQAIAIESRALADLLTTGGQSHIVDATIDGKHDSVLLREVQRDPITHRPIAADFQRVSQTEEIYTEVPIATVGVALGVKDQGGVMDVVTHALEVKGPAGKIPERFEIDVTSLAVWQHVTAGNVPLPAGFTLVTPPETIVVSIEGARTAVEETAVPAAAGAVETPAPATEG